MEIAANSSGTVSVFRRTVKLTAKGIHLGVVGDFDAASTADSEIYLWSCIKRKASHNHLLKLFLGWVAI